MFNFLLSKLIGTSNERYLKRIAPLAARINEMEPAAAALSDGEFPGKIQELRRQAIDGRPLDDLLPETFSLVREAARRALGMRHFDVQILGGIVLHQGKIAEMKTGEGKTLVATLPVVLNTLGGKGAHVITVNDYLARRDSEWMGQVYRFLGLSVGVIVHGLNDPERKAAYAADITYGTNNEFGFDYLRDNMKFYSEHLVQRELNFAIVDEVDSILIDEARTPLIISGPGEKSTSMYSQIDAVIPGLKAETDYKVDEKLRAATLTDAGVIKCEQALGLENMYDPRNITHQHHILQALKAHVLFQRDVDYIVKDGQVVIVDEFTGRLMPGRRYSDGLHQALEAKEKVKVEAENQTLATITFQNYFRMYDKLSGMTGTADTEAVEFKQIYNLDVTSIPPHKPMIRIDHADKIYQTIKEKFEAVALEIKELHEKGQPALVGTVSIEKSELLSHMLTRMGIPHNVLNAKHHEQEAAIIAEAGQKHKVTIATNMAGRGTDIVLGEGVVQLGGLHIIGTERHESRRIDNQLRGRSGRQGDPGSSRFYLALEDELLRIFGAERISGLMGKLGLKDGEAIEHSMLSRSIENAQRRVESHNFDIRKQLLEFDNTMNQQREVVYGLRRQIMKDENPRDTVEEFIDDLMQNAYSILGDDPNKAAQETVEVAKTRLEEIFCLSRALPESNILPDRASAEKAVAAILEELRSSAGNHYHDILRYFLLENLDRCWKDHLLNMDHLRDGIGLRGYGQKDPKQEYKREGFALFQEMLDLVKENSIQALCRVRIKEVAEDDFKHEEETEQSLNYSSGESESGGKKKPGRTARRAEPKVGRNDPCPCGSGKKYKKCCGT